MCLKEVGREGPVLPRDAPEGNGVAGLLSKRHYATDSQEPETSLYEQHHLYVLRPARPGMLTDGMTEAEQDTVAAHFEYLRGLADRGVVRIAGRTLDTGTQMFGFVVFRAASGTEAQRVVDENPAVCERVMTADLFPFRIAIDRS